MKLFKGFLAAVIVVVLLVGGSMAYAADSGFFDTYILEPVGDVMCEAVSWSVNRSFGDGPTLGIGVWKKDSKDRRRRTFLKFDLSALPGDIDVDRIERAELHLYRANFGVQSSGISIGAYRVLKDWVEGPGDMNNKVVDTPGICTWDYSNYPETWAAGGADAPGIDREETASSILDVPADDELVWTGLEGDVRDWYLGAKPNYGWLLMPLSETQELEYIHVHSKEASEPALDAAGVQYKPHLVVYVRRETPGEFQGTLPSPNPFIDDVRVAYYLPASGSVKAVIYDVAGNAVQEITSQDLNEGYNEIAWDGRCKDGTQAQAGIYLCVISLSQGDDTRTIASGRLVKVN